MNIFKIRDGSDKVYFRTLNEAKSENYQFRFHQDDEERLLQASEVDIQSKLIKYHFNDNEYTLPFSKVSIQILPSSKAVNIIQNPSPYLILVLMFVPLIIGIIAMEGNEFISRFIPANKDMIFGFGIAVIAVAYISQLVSAFYFSSLRKQRALRAVTSSSRLITNLEKASGVEEYFSRLIQVNLSNMEQYYLLVRNQTEKSYRLTQGASVIGFIILVSGIALSFQQGLNSSATALTIACGALIEFISAIFFYIYNKTISQLNTYHEKLVAVQDTMLALKVAQIVKDKKLKDETMAYLTKALTSKLGEANNQDQPIIKANSADGNNRTSD